MKYFKIFISLVLFYFSVSCTDHLNSGGGDPLPNDYLKSTDFSGALYAKNILSGIEITWDAANPEKNILGYNIYRYSLGEKILYGIVDSSSTQFIDGNVTSGSQYDYLVKAVDPNGNEDPNEKIVKGIAWSGLDSVTSTTTDSITVSFDSRLQGYSLYLYIARLGEARPQEPIAKLDTKSELDLGEYIITEYQSGILLSPGSQYDVYAELVEATGTRADGNQVAYKVNTLSYGYEGDEPGWKNIASLRAFGYSPGTRGPAADSVHSDDEENYIVPTLPQVDIAFLPFELPAILDSNSTIYRYVVIRASFEKTLDTSAVSNICPTEFDAENSDEPCLVPLRPDNSKTAIHPVNDLTNGLVHVVDRGVWKSEITQDKPPRYRYTMAIKHLSSSDSDQGYIEKIPSDQIEKFSVLVPIPPQDMVLVNREAVNFEHCRVQKSASSDPQNHNRCASSEVGRIPFNQGPGYSALALDESYFDFGYNLFVDRYPLACNANNYLEGGSPTDSNYLTTLPDSQPSEVSIIYANYGTSTSALSNCFYNASSSEKYNIRGVGNLPEYKTIFSQMLSSSPSNGSGGKAYRPLTSYSDWDVETAVKACESFSSPGYGQKRIPRMREYRAFTAPVFRLQEASQYLKDPYYETIAKATSTHHSESSHGGSAWTPGDCLINTALSGGTKFLSSTSWTSLVSSSPLPLNPIESGNSGDWSYSSNYGPAGLLIGAKNNAHCMSRYGIANINESSQANTTALVQQSAPSSWYAVSDYFTFIRTSGTHGDLIGATSIFDSGNLDVSYDITTGEQTGFINEFNIGTTSNQTLDLSNYGTSKFNLSLGIPVISSQQGVGNYNSYPSSSIENYQLSLIAYFPNNNGSNYLEEIQTSVTARWTSYFFRSEKGSISRVRCVLPAD